MSCCGSRRDKGPPEHTQKWEYITLSDFRSTSSWNGFAYAWLWLMAFIAVAVYAVDTMTAVNLLVFDRWSSQINPAVPLKYSKWIFAACILFSWVLCIYEWIRAIRVIRRGGVAESYMDPLAVSLQSMRGSGWRRFLLFTELTKSKKGADYVALFVYFAFKGSVRIILAEGPRQAINAMSLYAVMNADLVPHTTTKVSNFEQFWINLGDMANKDQTQAMIFFSMLFTLIIWVISALSLISAAICYIFFLWHYIPQADGRLSIYCRRKIDRRLEKIVERKIIAANEEEERNRVKYARKIEALQMKSGTSAPLPPAKLVRAPTLPQIGSSPDLNKEESNIGLMRQNTNASTATLPQYSSRPPTRAGYESGQPGLGEKNGPRPDMPTRFPTQSSMVSYASDAPLLANTGFSGEEYRGVSAPGLPTPTYNRSGPVKGAPMRSRFGSQSTLSTQRSFTPGPPRYGNPGSFLDGRQGPFRGAPSGSVPRNGAPDSFSDGGYGTTSNNMPGPMARTVIPGHFADGNPAPVLRNGTPGPQWNGQQGPPRYAPPAPSLPHVNSSSLNEPAYGPEPTLPTPNTMAGFDFGLPGSNRADFSAATPSPSTQQPVYQPLKLQPITTWHKAYDDRPVPVTGSQNTLQNDHPLPNFQPFSPASSSARDVPTNKPFPPESFEMKQQPTHISPVQTTTVPSYVAFKPAVQAPAVSAPTLHIGQPSPTRSVSPMSATSDSPNDYFGKVRVVSSLSPPQATENRLTVLGYGDILDDYGAEHVPTPGSHPRSAAPSPLPGQQSTTAKR